MPPNHQTILQCLPDLPRWVEARSMLLSGRGLALDFRSKPEPSGALLQEDIGLGVVIGKPDPGLLFQLSELADEIICPVENAIHCANIFESWSQEGATLYLRNKQIPLPQLELHHLRILEVGELSKVNGLPEMLYEELQDAGSEIFCATQDNKPVAFCYAGAVSESLWDISVDTLPAYRRQGYARQSVVYAISIMAKRDLAPIWAAVDSNTASRALADNLGFIPADRIVVFTRRS